MEVSTLYPSRVTLWLHTLLGLGLILAGSLVLLLVLSSKLWFEWIDSDPSVKSLATLHAKPHKYWNLRMRSQGHVHFLDLPQQKEIPLFAGDTLELPSTWVRREVSGKLRTQSDEESSVLLTHSHGALRVLPNTSFTLMAKKDCSLALNLSSGALSLYMESEKHPLCLQFKDQNLRLINPTTPGWLRIESRDDEELFLFPRGLTLKKEEHLLDKEAYQCTKNACSPVTKTPSIWFPPSHTKEMKPLELRGPYPNARFISTTNNPIWVPIEVRKIPVGSTLELEMIRWDDPDFQPQTVPSRHGLLVPLRNGNYRYRVRLKDAEGHTSDWTQERQLSIQEYHYGGRSALPIRQ